MEWTQYNGVGSRETLFKKYSVNCWKTKCVYLIMTRGDKYKRDLERHKRLRGLYG